MLKNKRTILLLIILVVLTGCTKQLKNVDNQIVKNKKTGQTLPANILCKPTDKDIIKLYDKTKDEYIVKLDKQLKKKKITKAEYKKQKSDLVDVSKLTKCSKFTPATGGYEGLWTTIFVKPLTWLIIQVGQIVRNYGLSVIIITLLIRLILYPVTKKSAKQSELMKKAQPDLNKLEKKYKNKKDQTSMQMKSQEMLAIYKKYGINPMAGCIFGFIQIPLFLAFYESLYRLPAIFEGNFLIFKMSVAPITAATKLGYYYYFILPVLVLVVTYFSFKLNSNASMNEDQAKQMKLMMNIMMIVIFFTSFQMSTAIILYWITNSAFTIVQNLIVKRSMKDDKSV